MALVAQKREVRAGQVVELAAAAQRRAPRERVGPRQFVREVKAELRKVAWPSREEVVRLSGVVLFTVILLTALIFGLDYVFAKSVFFLFDK